MLNDAKYATIHSNIKQNKSGVNSHPNAQAYTT